MDEERRLTRRGALRLAACAAFLTACTPGSPRPSGRATAGPSPVPPTTTVPPTTATTTTTTTTAATPVGRPVTIAYGADRVSQLADLSLPAGTHRVPVVVVIHGGYWQKDFGYSLGAPLAASLVAAGVAAWNIEYRRIGNGGGWPATFEDVAAAIDALADTGQSAAHGRLDLSRVAVVGHSAGGTLALWAAARPHLPAGAPGAAPRVRVVGAVSQAGVVDLTRGAADQLGGGAIEHLMGGEPAQRRDRYAVADPALLVPVGVPVVLVHGTADDVVPLAQSQSYVKAATAAGDHPRLLPIAGADHFALIDPASQAWAACQNALLAMVGR